MKACFGSATLGPGRRRDDRSGVGLGIAPRGKFPSSSFRRRPEFKNSRPAMNSSSNAVFPNETALCLHHGQSEKRNALHRSHLRSRAAHLATQKQPGRRIHQEIRDSYASLVRAARSNGVSHLTGKNNQGMATCLENQAHRIHQSAMAGSLRRDRLMYAFWTPAFAGVTEYQGRHSGAGRNPEFRSSDWVPAFTRTTELRCMP